MGVDIVNFRCPLALELPLPSAHGAELCRRLGVHPLEYAVKMEGVVAGAPDERTIVPGELAVGAAAVERHPAYATRLVLRIPRPRSHRVPLENLDLHSTWK